MAKNRIEYSPWVKKIQMGKVLVNGSWIGQPEDVTQDVIEAVFFYLRQNYPDGIEFIEDDTLYTILVKKTDSQ
jgi:hypothetical protein